MSRDLASRHARATLAAYGRRCRAAHWRWLTNASRERKVALGLAVLRAYRVFRIASAREAG